MPIEILLPDIGDFEDVEVIEVLVAEGDTIAAEDSLISVESDKASMEIPSPQAGVVTEVKVALGDKVSEGSLILMLEPSAEEPATGPDSDAPAPVDKVPEPVAEPAPAPKSRPAEAAPVSRPSPTAKIDEVSFSRAYASPSVRKFARELGVNLGQVSG
ncbi:biotin/lipoyl-containing protein, partial [Kaarinaea lacus]